MKAKIDIESGVLDMVRACKNSKATGCSLCPFNDDPYECYSMWESTFKSGIDTKLDYYTAYKAI